MGSIEPSAASLTSRKVDVNSLKQHDLPVSKVRVRTAATVVVLTQTPLGAPRDEECSEVGGTGRWPGEETCMCGCVSESHSHPSRHIHLQDVAAEVAWGLSKATEIFVRHLAFESWSRTQKHGRKTVKVRCIYM